MTASQDRFGEFSFLVSRCLPDILESPTETEVSRSSMIVRVNVVLNRTVVDKD